EYRNAHGRFDTREELLKVPKLGPKAFEQAAGFMRIRYGSQPLDNSAVHPESYPIVERMAKSTNASTRELVGNATLVRQLKAADYVSDEVGLPTVEDILSELEKPGRDPRKEFRMPSFADAVTEITDLKPGMTLEGVVTNVTNFGAFVDVGVHQDGLVHISEIADRFVKDPADEVSVGDVVRVKVLSVEVERKRIALTRKV
ncbi:MAG: S1 RNA-binding domain-containing protein, partial [Planctomycetes bacterium]|nr:S1 RNA-binding domain-containing protein [Planctomycetota bacterium]